jgi:hypothetical protein
MKARFSLMLLCTVLTVPVLAREYTARVTLHIVDDEGRAISGAKAAASFVRQYASKESERVNTVRGISDASGLVTFEGKTVEAGIGYGAEKDTHYNIGGTNYQFTSRGFLRLLPWNPTIEVVLKRIKTPVPMYAKRMDKGPPVLEETIGYDLQVGDWVAPQGRGKVADMLFIGRMNQKGDRVYDWNMKLTFSNPGDGIQRFKPDPEYMRFRSPYEAPEAGYLPEWNLHRTRLGPTVREQTDYDDTGGYFFRVRTVLDKDGRVVSALYGKIYGEIFFNMVHYLNPDGTRNMEFDPKRNLLKPASNRDRSAYEVGP